VSLPIHHGWGEGDREKREEERGKGEREQGSLKAGEGRGGHCPPVQCQQ